MTSNSEPSPLSRLSLNSATTKKLTLAEVVDGCVRAGIPAIAPWRDRFEEAGLDKAAKLIKDAGLRVSSLCRGGFLTAPDAEGQAAALADNRAAVLEAAVLDTRELFLVVGGRAPGEKDVVAVRQRVADRLADLVPFATENGIRLVLEPLHPMYAADRAVISTLGQALDLAAPFNAHAVGVAVATISTWVRDAGYTGDIEVEIFNQEIWDTDGDAVMETVKARYAELVRPYA